MKKEDILRHIDHTNLNVKAKWEDIEKLCNEAIEYNTACVCIPLSYVKRVRDSHPDIKISGTVGFPLGYTTTYAKIEEVKEALKNGADEIDMVINITDVKNKDFNLVKEEIRSIKEIVGDKILKVIIETCYLNEVEKIKMCEIITETGADYIKTSTGFGTAGANYEDIKLFKKHIGENVKIKAAGGISNREEMEEYIRLGCDRLGMSSGIKILEDK